MDEIKYMADDEGEGRGTRRGSQCADHHIVRDEVQGRDDDPKRDCAPRRVAAAISAARSAQARVKLWPDATTCPPRP